MRISTVCSSANTDGTIIWIRVQVLKHNGLCVVLTNNISLTIDLDTENQWC